MLVSEYDKFVTETDQYRDNSDEERQKIALYGLVGEIGSLVSAVKKTSTFRRWEPNLEYS